jgi:hypothetical protein
MIFHSLFVRPTMAPTTSFCHRNLDTAALTLQRFASNNETSARESSHQRCDFRIAALGLVEFPHSEQVDSDRTPQSRCVRTIMPPAAPRPGHPTPPSMSRLTVPAQTAVLVCEVGQDNRTLRRLSGLIVVCFGRFWTRDVPFANARFLGT